MSEVMDARDLADVSSPYRVTKSFLGTNTKIMSDKFLCSQKEIFGLCESFQEKLSYFKPSKIGFQYLVSFTDNTHFENSNLNRLDGRLSSSGKRTNKLILNWVVVHEFEGEENELSITIRISNPINPLVMLQAALSQSPGDIDNIEMEAGSVSVSVNGATQSVSEEIFELVARWIKGCRKPYSITRINSTISKHRYKIFWLNNWLFPIVYAFGCFFYIKDMEPQVSNSYLFIFLCGFIILKSLSNSVNRNIERWCHTSRMFSLFDMTGGDSNQQTEYAAKSKNSTIKLIGSTFLSLILNLISGYVVAKYLLF